MNRLRKPTPRLQHLASGASHPNAEMATLIVTLQLDSATQAFFEHLRRQHFPPERNLIPAHLTLFHQLPESDEVVARLQQAGTEQPPFPLQCTGIRSLGRGVAYQLASPTLQSLHGALVTAFYDNLIAQDKQHFAPHVVVQNKVQPEQARQLLIALKSAALPTNILATGLDLWQYLGGPWRHLQSFAFV